MEAALKIVNQTFVSILSGNFICICTVFSVTSGWPSQRNDSLQPRRFVNDIIIIFEMQTQIYPLSSERAELSLINQCGCLPLPRPRGLLVLVQTGRQIKSEEHTSELQS